MTVSRFLLILFGAVTLSAVAQTEKPADLPTWKLKNYVTGYERIGDIYTAINMAEEFVSRRPHNKKIKTKLAELYVASRDYKAAAETYEQLFEEGGDMMTHFNYAMMTKRVGKYGKAENLFQSFLKKYPKTAANEEYFNIIENELKGAQFASGQVTDTNLVMVHLDSNVNMAHIDFSPFPVNDSILLYASLKTNEVTFVEDEEIPKRRFYMAQRLDTGSYKTLSFPYSFNDPAMDCGNGVFSEDGSLFVFSKCTKATPTSKAFCKLYQSNCKNGKCDEPREMPSPINAADFSTSYPCFGITSRKEEVLYFSSNRPGGKGGMDIWYSIYDAKKAAYKSPKNCGKEINSTRDDISPYYNTVTKLFYYSTEGHAGFGGLDVFRTEGELKRWNKSKNMGMPINSPADDLYYIQRKDNETGYMVSNREGGIALENATCCDDIYEFYVKKPVNLYVIGKVTEEQDVTQSTGKQATGIIGLYLDIDNKLVLVDKVPLPLSNDFEFKLSTNTKYKLITEKDGFFRTSTRFSTEGKTKSDTIYVMPVLRQIPYAPIIVKNIYYPFDKDYLTAASKVIIDTTIFQIMVDNPEIIVEIGSHTDGLGTNEYNDDLSQRRAQSVVNYLILQGIAENRLTAKGYGKRIPIATNQNPDGSDNPDGRQRNRRTEFKVIGVLPGVSDIIYEE